MNLSRFADLLDIDQKRYDHNVSEIKVRDESEDEIDSKKNIIYDDMKTHDTFVQLTNFTNLEIVSILQQIQPFASGLSTQGKPPKLTWIDSILVLLMYYKSGSDLNELSGFIKIPSSTLLKAINRVRHLVHLVLSEKYTNNRKRPQPFENATFPYVALGFDHTTFEIQKPVGKFRENKVYFDKKNKIYGMKKGIAIQSNSPNYALFITNAIPGSVHDSQDLKHNCHTMLPYLRKTADEVNLIPHDADHPYWGVSLDKGYIGDSSETVNLRKSIPYKKPSTPVQITHNSEWSKVHNPMERFFGRMKKIWRITSRTYKNDLQSIDVDMDNCIFLTNEHIRTHQLQPVDDLYLRQLESYKIDYVDTITRKRKMQQEEYRRRTQLRMTQSPNEQVIHSLLNE
jgi:hypothetical protein